MFDDRPVARRGGRRLRGGPAAPPHGRRGHAATRTATWCRRWRTSGSWAARAVDRAAHRLARGRARAPRASTRAGSPFRRPRGRSRAATGTASGSRSWRWRWWRSPSGCSRRSTGPGSCPGPTAMALVAAGYVAGRGPVAAVGRRPRRPDLRARPAARRRRAAGRRAWCWPRVLVAWAIWQPEASRARRRTGPCELADAGQLRGGARRGGGRGRRRSAVAGPAARPRARSSSRPAASAGPARTLERAVLSFPGDPDTWLRLTRFQLVTLDRPRQAL